MIKGFKLQNDYRKLYEFPIVVSTIICVVYGGLLELMQGAFYIDRTADLYDFIANSAGVFIGIIFFRRKF